MRRARLVVSAALAAACEPEFTPASVVDSLRVLAVRSEPAAVAPGETATLTPLVADPRGGGRAVAYEWAACAYPEGGDVVVLLPPDCAAAERGPLLLGDAAALAFVVPPDLAELADVNAYTSSSGTFALPLRLRVRGGDEEQTAIASVAVAFGDGANRNPELTGVTADGEPLYADDPVEIEVGGNERHLRATWTVDSAEPYTVVAQGTGQTLEQVEVPAVAWFASVGRFEPDHSSEGFEVVGFSADEPAEPGVAPTIWGVLSDGRGGVDWFERRVIVRGR